MVFWLLMVINVLGFWVVWWLLCLGGFCFVVDV